MNPTAQLLGDSLVDGIDQGFPSTSSEPVYPFLWPITDESTERAFELLPSRGGSSLAASPAVPTQSMGGHTGDDIFDFEAAESSSLSSFQPQEARRRNMQPQNRADHSHTLIRHLSSPHSFGPSNPFAPGRKTDIPMSGASIPTPPTAPNTQTTIVLNDAEPTTLSAIMSILFQSKAKVRFETR